MLKIRQGLREIKKSVKVWVSIIGVYIFASFANNALAANLRAYNDTVWLTYNESITFDALANDVLTCDRNQAIVEIVRNSGLRRGNLAIDGNEFTYTPAKDIYGIDSVQYSIRCGTDTRRAKVYFIILKPMSLRYAACPEAHITVGMYPIPEVEYYWYSVSTGKPFGTTQPANSRFIKKNTARRQSWYLDVMYRKRKLSRRHQISLERAYDCGNTSPDGCAVKGQLLFREDFGGNSTGSPRISLAALPDGTTDYDFKKTDNLKRNQYALVKNVNPAEYYRWQRNFSDHTHPKDLNRGYMFLVDAAKESGKFYETRITNLCDNIKQLYFSAWVANVIPADNPVADDPILRFELLDDDGNVIETYVTSSVPRDSQGRVQWRNYGFTFDPKGYSSLTLRIYNNHSGSNGNDFALDDIEIRMCVSPVILKTKLVDEVCIGKPYTFHATYHDDGTFTGKGDKLMYRWQYSPVNNARATWTTTEEGTVETNVLDATFTVDEIKTANQGYYRLVIGNSATIDRTNCRVVSKSIHLTVKNVEPQNDMVIAKYNQPLNIDILANDSLACVTDLSRLQVELVAGSGLRSGKAWINPDKTFTYIADNNVFGIDSVDYAVKYLSTVGRARVYIVIPRALSVYNTACPKTNITVGMHAVKGVKYYWYSVPEGGTPLSQSPANEITVTKDNSDVQSWYVEARYRDRISLRYPITVSRSDDCGNIYPTGCAVEGQLLFREDFGGNSVSSPRISAKPLDAGTTDYIFQGTDRLIKNQYTLVKYIDPGTSHRWQKDFSDHTHPDDKSRGYMFLVDASENPGKFYERRITGLCDRIERLYFSVWTVNITPGNDRNAEHDPMLKFELLDDNQNIIGTYLTSSVPRDDEGKTKWRNYGFSFDPKGYHSLTLKIYNNRKGSNGNDFALDDIEVRLCVPYVKMEYDDLSDTVCTGSKVRLQALYDDGKLSKNQTYRWEYSADGNQWSVIGKDTLAASSAIRSVYGVDSATMVDRGYYRFVIIYSAASGNPACDIVSEPVFVNVVKAYRAPDLRVAVEPSGSPHTLRMSNFVDVIGGASIKWDNAGAFPAFADVETGALDVQKLAPKQVYTCKYTLTWKCGSSSAKAYLLTSTGGPRFKNNREIFVCRDLEMSKYVNLNQILGMDNEGKWSFPNDPDGVIIANIHVSSAKYGGSRIFNAYQAYAEAGDSYAVAGDPGKKAFKFNYDANGKSFSFTVIVGSEKN
jgi:hypothetical protein